MRKVFCATLGCDKNLVDSEALLGRFARDGVQPVDDPETADIWVLNSCGFIDAARADSEETLRDMADRKEGRILVVTGCWSQEHGDDIRIRFPGVDVVAGVGQFDEVVAAVREGRPTAGLIPDQPGDFPLAGPPIVGDPMTAPYVGLLDRPLLTPGHLAFVKIGEGCNCTCTFCRIPLIRGKLRSRPTAEVVAEVRALVARGVTEIQLVSQNTSDYGRDTGENLVGLVKALNEIDGLRRMRLLYLYAGLVSVEDLQRILQMEKVAPYLEIPIQHASPRILKAMKRPGGFKASPDFFGALRAERPDLVLRSTALLGLARLGRKFECVVDRVVDSDAPDADEIIRILGSLSEGAMVEGLEQIDPEGVLQPGVSLAVARSYHFGYDLDGVILMDGRGLNPGDWIDGSFEAVTPFDVWARPHR